LIKPSLHGLIRRANDSRKLDHATLEVLQMRGAASRGEHPAVLAATPG
jgi:hypothetical protein